MKDSRGRRTVWLLCLLATGLGGAILVRQAAAQRPVIRLEGEGRLSPEADKRRGTSPAYGYEGTPHAIVPAVIELAGVVEGDVVHEPGCGDARVLIAAVRAGARRGLGVDIDPDLAEVAYANVRKAGLLDRIEIHWGNALDVEMSDATVVFLFMGEGFNRVIRPKLWEELPVGARIVSIDFPMGNWQPDRVVHVDTLGRTYTLYRWTITEELKLAERRGRPQRD